MGHLRFWMAAADFSLDVLICDVRSRAFEYNYEGRGAATLRVTLSLSEDAVK
jgi:hypothetical protein